jgi:hypothetical protein
MPATIQGQQTYANFPAFAQPGQLADLTYCEIASFPAAEQINPGRVVELAADNVSCQQVQDAGATTPPAKMLGISVLVTAREGAGAFNITPYGVAGPQYQIGDTVPVLMRGRIYAEWSGTTQTPFSNGVNGAGLLHLYSSSTVATNRGKLTDVAVSAGAGTEVLYAGQGIRVRQALPGAGNIVLVDINLPGAA